MQQEPVQNEKLIRKVFLGYALTFTAINFSDSLTMIADGMVISRGLGVEALAAVGLADPSYKFVLLFAGVLSAGLQSLCAQAMGSGDRKKAGGVFSAGLVTAAAISVLLTVLCFACTDSLCRLFGAQAGTEHYVHLYKYLRGWFTGIPGYIMFFVLSPLVTLDGNKKNVTAATVIQSIVNIAGDVLAIFVFDAGAHGIGLATGFAYNISAIVVILNFVRKRSVFKLFGERPDFSSLPAAVRIGMPNVTKQISKMLAPLLVNRTVIAVGGSLAMSAISVKAGIMGFCVIVANGIAESVGLMTQILYSEKDATSLKQAVKVSLKAHSSFDTVFAALLFIFAGYAAALYFEPASPEHTMAVTAVRCLALSLPFMGCNAIIAKYLQGARKIRPVHTFTLLLRMISPVVFTMLLGFLFGAAGLFAAVPVSEAAVMLGYVVLALRSGGKKDIWNSLLLIPDEFGYNSENSFSASISTIEEAVAVSKRIEAFCNEHQDDKKKSAFSALCMEELSANIILHGFTGDEKKHHCDVRVMIDPDAIVLRVRDDCPYFNIRERYDSLAEDDIDAGVWIRLVFAIAKDVNYINIFNTNTLIIRI